MLSCTLCIKWHISPMWLGGLHNICATSCVYIHISCHYNKDIYIVLYCIVLINQQITSVLTVAIYRNVSFIINQSMNNKHTYYRKVGLLLINQWIRSVLSAVSFIINQSMNKKHTYSCHIQENKCYY